MAFASPVPDSGGGSGSSTATFGDSIGHVFAMPTRHSDTSSAAEGSGVDVAMPVRQPRRRPQGSNSASPGARSLGHATSPRHGGPSTSPTSRMAPTQSRSAGSQGVRGQDQRGRSGSRKLSDTVGGFQEHSVRSPFSPVGSHGESMQRDRSHYGSPSQHASAVGSPSYVPTRLDTPVLTPHHSYTPTRVDTPAWEVREDIDGHPEETKRSEQWITDPCHRILMESDLTVRPLEQKRRPQEEKLCLIIRVIILPQLRQQNLCQIVQLDSI